MIRTLVMQRIWIKSIFFFSLSYETYFVLLSLRYANRNPSRSFTVLSRVNVMFFFRFAGVWIILKRKYPLKFYQQKPRRVCGFFFFCYCILSLGPPMKERFFRWLVFILVVTSVDAEKSNSKDDEDDGYEIASNEEDEHDEATSRMLQLINNAAMKIIDSPDLSKVWVRTIFLLCRLFLLL